MVGLSDPVLTEHEAELYDRQIRLWGLESQKRLRAARILIAGVSGLAAEIAKNIILAGVKSVVLLDDTIVSEVDKCSQFLLPTSAIGLNRAEASLQRARALNPMVEIRADTRSANVSADNYVGDDYFNDYDVVFVTGFPTNTIVALNEICREKKVKFFTGDVWGRFGYSFADLQEHEYVEDVVKHKIVSKPNEKPKTELVTTTAKRSMVCHPFKKLLEIDLKYKGYCKRYKHASIPLLVLRILQTYRDEFGHDPDYTNRAESIKELLKIRGSIGGNLVEDNLFQDVFAQISPAAAIVGGQVAQEIIKTVSQKEAPHMFFLFDHKTCCGSVQTIFDDVAK